MLFNVYKKGSNMPWQTSCWAARACSEPAGHIFCKTVPVGSCDWRSNNQQTANTILAFTIQMYRIIHAATTPNIQPKSCWASFVYMAKTFHMSDYIEKCWGQLRSQPHYCLVLGHRVGGPYNTLKANKLWDNIWCIVIYVSITINCKTTTY